MSTIAGNLINGTPFSDSLIGTAGDDTINASTGVDTVRGNGGDDLISIIVADEFSDEVEGGDGVDTLVVRVQDTSGSYWIPTDMYWVGYTEAGAAVGMIALGGNYDMAYADLALAQPWLKLNTSNGNPGAWIRNASFENFSIQTSQRDDSDDMMLLRGVGTYDGYGGFNGIYADWSALSDPIVWDNAANATVQSVGGSSISNVQRLLVKSGAGDDDIRNTAVVTDDEFVTGAGHDTIYAGGGKDRVDAGAGDDFISVVVGSEFADTVHGGTGNDTLIVTAVVPETSPWMSKNMYFTGYDAQGAFTGQAAAGSATMANADAAMSGVSLKLNTANGYPGVMMDGIENLSLMANPSDDSLDMLFVIGNGTYNGYAGVDALYANWSGASADIVWNNLANATPQPVSGSTISNVERLLVRTGSGNDDIRNTALVTDDELETGPGNDTIHSGGGKDRVDAGAGDDFVSVVVGSEFADTVHGGDGIDRLLITAVVPDSSPWQSKNMSLVGYDAQGVVTASAYPDSSFSRVTQALGGVSFKLNTGNGYPGVSFDGVERLSLVANPSDDSYDLLVVLGSGTYSGGGGTDTLYADWSATQDAIVWNNLADASTHSVNGSLISGVERLLLKTGAGSDDIRNLVAITHDEIETGAGQDTVHAGAGNDRIHPGAGNDIVDAGAGTDTAVFTGNLNLYSVTRNASGTVVLLSSAAEGSDRISNVETFQFADGALATSALGGVDSSAPAVLDAEPADEATGASTQDDIVIRFGETIERASGTARLKNGAGDIVESFNVATSARITVAGNSLILDPSADLASMTSYRIEIDAGSLTDRVGNAMAAITGYNFTTGAASYNGTPGDDGLTGDSWGNTFTPGLGNDRIDADGGVDTVVLPMFPNVFTLTESSPGQVTGSYGTSTPYTLVLNDVEFVQFGRPASAGDPERFQTTIALSELVSGAAQLQLGRLTDLYLAFFGRAPDVSGLEYWQERLLEEGRDFATISKDFAWSLEAQALFPPAASNREFVRTVYLNCFGREPDPGGWDYWTGRLDGLGVTDLNDRGAFVGEVILGAYASTSGEEDRSLLSNRHEAAMYYANRLAIDPGEGFDTAINTLLNRVTGDAATGDKAEAVIDYAFAHPITLTGVMSDQALFDSLWS